VVSIRFPLLVAAGLSCLAALAISTGASADTTLPGGTLTNDTTWDLAGSPYTLDGDVIVPPGVTLTIDAGVEVGWNLTYVLQVEGGLIINGTAASPVYLYATGSSFYPHWVGILFLGHTIDSVIRNATLETATVAIDVQTPAASLVVDDVEVTAWTTYGDWGLRVEGATSNVAVHRLDIHGILEGTYFGNSTGLEIMAVQTSNLGRTPPLGLSAYNLRATVVDGLDLSGAGVYIGSSSDLTVRNASASTGAGLTTFEVGNSTTISLHGASLQGTGGFRLLAQNVTDLVVEGLVSSTAGSPSGDAHLRMTRGGGALLHNLTASGGDRAVWADNSTGLHVGNLTASNLNVGLLISSCPAFVVDGATLSVAAVGLTILPPSEGGRVSNTSINTSSFGFDMVVGNGWAGDLDVSAGNTVNGRPVLGLYRQPGSTVADASAFGWVYAFGSANSAVEGVRLPAVGGSRPAAVWTASPGGVLRDWDIQSQEAGMFINDSASTSLDGVRVAAPMWALGGSISPGLSVANSHFNASVGPAFTVSASQGVLISNSTMRGGAGGARILLSSATLRGVQAWGGSSSGALVQLADARIEDSMFCGGQAGLRVVYVAVAVIGNLSFCPGSPGLLIEASTAVVEGSTFDGLPAGLRLLQGGTGAFRDNRFVNCTGPGLSVDSASGNGMVAFENRFACGGLSANDSSPFASSWYNATTRRGNWWDDYGGTDADRDGVGDTPYDIPGGPKQDIYPLVDLSDDMPPVAVAFAPYSIDEDTPAPLDGSNSTDDSGNLTGWWLVDLPSGTVNVSGLVAAYTFDTPGTYNLTLVVSDGSNRSTATTWITVRDTTRPTISPTPDNFTGNEDTAIPFTVQVTDNDPAFPDGATFEWTLHGATPVMWTSFGPSTQVTLDDPGNYTLTAAVTDAAGNRASRDFTVTARDVTPPVCSGSVDPVPPPGTGGRFTLIMQYEPDNDPWFPLPGALRWTITTPAGDTRTGQGTPYDFITEGAGAYTVSYSCTDPSGNRATGTFSVTVPDTQAPSWDAPGPLVVAEGQRLAISAEDATDDTGISGWAWFDGEYAIASGPEINPVWEGLGDHHVRVQIADAAGNSANFSVLVRVVDRTAPWLRDSNFTQLRTVRAGDILSIDAEGIFLDNDPNFAVAGSIQWEADGPVAGWSLGSYNRSVDVVYASQGNWTLHVTVTDPSGNNATFELPVLVQREGPTGPPDGGGTPAGALVLPLLAAVLAAGGVAAALFVLRKRRSAGP
jgi:hypothetical protein